ncbi:MAG: DUF1365 domain-containing protein [Pseudomonadota bacterium]
MRQPEKAVPQLCFGLVRHARLRPVRNSFAYGTYYLRLPLRSLGGGGFDSRLISRNRFNLLSFVDADHGDGKQPLLAWIDHLLKEEGVFDADGEIWLQAMPRVAGFVFNPVSFWFCHRKDGALRAVLCDVRNTFGERHCYLLDTGAVIANGQELAARKVFHVSPFCAVEGGYRFRFSRFGRSAGEHTLACIDYDDAAGTLLQTSVSGAARALSDASVARAFFGFPLMTLGVVVRIHVQALRLWLRRVPFFSKPVPPQQKVSR